MSYHYNQKHCDDFSIPILKNVSGMMQKVRISASVDQSKAKIVEKICDSFTTQQKNSPIVCPGRDSKNSAL